jgi:hypothetical protein
MYQFTKQDQNVLFRLERTDDIAKLTMLKPATIETLRTDGCVNMINDLPRLDMIWLDETDSIPESEKQKIEAICRFFIHGA